jgi:SAM-dependent methyltransferase
VSKAERGAVTGADDWDQHWDEYATVVEASPAQQYRHDLALRLLEQGGRPARLLDLGSGQGDLLLDARERWPDVHLLGIEPSESGVRESKRKVPDATFFSGDLTAGAELPGELRGWASHAVCSEVLEHVNDPVELLRGALPAMAPRCRLVVTVPGGRMSAFDHKIGHRQHFTPESLATVLTDAGLEVEWTSGAGFPFFNLYRALVIARGERLADDVAMTADGGPKLSARLAMSVFRPLFRFTLTRSRWGIQVIGVARRTPGDDRPAISA